MRKVKVVAAFLCLTLSGMLGSIRIPEQSCLPAACTMQRELIAPLTAESVTTAASIQTTAISAETTAEATVRQTSETTAETTASPEETAAETTVTEETEIKEATTTGTEAVSDAGEKTKAVSTYANVRQMLAEIIPESTTASAVTTAVTKPVTTAPPAATAQVTVTTTAAATTAAPVTTVTTTVTEAPVTTTPAPAETTPARAVSVTEREYIMLCNVVGHEYGADWVPVEEKALVAEVIMNRVNSPAFPNTVYAVLTQKGQFAGIEYLIEMETYSHYVTDSVREAVDLYLSDPSQFDHGYLFFNGDGRRNYFRTSYYG